MELMDKFTISASMLLTGFTIVFSVLIFLIFIIWLYGFIITRAQGRVVDKKNEKKKVKIERKPDEKPIPPVENKPAAQAQSDGLSDEVVAVISAAVYSMYGSKDKVRIKSIKKSASRSAWGNAGILNNTRPF